MHFSLIHQAPLALMHKLDWILNGQNVVVPVVIDVINHRREGCGLTRTRGSGDQHQPSGQQRYIAEYLPHTKGFHGQNLRRDGAEYRAGAPVLVEGVNSEAGDIGYFKRKIGLQEFLKIPALPIIHNVVNQRLHLGMVLSRDVDTSYVAVHPDHGG